MLAGRAGVAVLSGLAGKVSRTTVLRLPKAAPTAAGSVPAVRQAAGETAPPASVEASTECAVDHTARVAAPDVVILV